MDSNLPPASPSAPPPPPPLNPPPPIIVAPVSTPPRKSRVWMVIAIVLFVLLGLSLLANFGQLLDSLAGLSGTTHQRSGAPRLDEVVLEENHSSEKIAMIPVEGIISGDLGDRGGFSMVDIIEAQLERAEKDKRVKAIVLKVDSPGGEVLASDDIARA